MQAVGFVKVEDGGESRWFLAPEAINTGLLSEVKAKLEAAAETA